jgi:hypothetical protein
MTMGRSEPTGRDGPNYKGVLQYMIQLMEETWPTLPHPHLENPVLSPTARQMTPGTWDGEPTLHNIPVPL